MPNTCPLQSYAHDILQAPQDRLNPQRRRKRVFAATLGACARSGPFALKIIDIAEAAGVSTATIYKDFIDGPDVLKQSTLAAFKVLEKDWQQMSSGANDPPALVADHAQSQDALLAYLVRFGELYRAPYTHWLMRADMAAAACNAGEVRNAAVALDAAIVRYGVKLLPADMFGFPNGIDLINLLIGSMQRKIVHAMFACLPEKNVLPNAQALDLVAAAQQALDWLAISTSRYQTGDFHDWPVGCIEVPEGALQKSASHKHVESILNSTFNRRDVAARRDRILAATLLHCYEYGLTAINVTHIAKCAGVSTATVYQEFEDKAALVNASIMFIIPVYAKASLQSAPQDDPKIWFETMLITQTMTFIDPFLAWLFRHYVELEAQYDNPMQMIGRAGRAQSAQFWSRQLTQLEQDGILVPTDHETTVNMIFGGLHRRSVLARVFYDDEAFVWSEVVTSVKVATSILFRVYGTDKA